MKLFHYLTKHKETTDYQVFDIKHLDKYQVIRKVAVVIPNTSHYYRFNECIQQYQLFLQQNNVCNFSSYVSISFNQLLRGLHHIMPLDDDVEALSDDELIEKGFEHYPKLMFNSSILIISFYDDECLYRDTNSSDRVLPRYFYYSNTEDNRFIKIEKIILNESIAEWYMNTYKEKALISNYNDWKNLSCYHINSKVSEAALYAAIVNSKYFQTLIENYRKNTFDKYKENIDIIQECLYENVFVDLNVSYLSIDNIELYVFYSHNKSIDRFFTYDLFISICHDDYTIFKMLDSLTDEKGTPLPIKPEIFRKILNQ